MSGQLDKMEENAYTKTYRINFRSWKFWLFLALWLGFPLWIVLRNGLFSDMRSDWLNFSVTLFMGGCLFLIWTIVFGMIYGLSATIPKRNWKFSWRRELTFSGYFLCVIVFFISLCFLFAAALSLFGVKEIHPKMLQTQREGNHRLGHAVLMSSNTILQNVSPGKSLCFGIPLLAASCTGMWYCLRLAQKPRKRRKSYRKYYRLEREPSGCGESCLIEFDTGNGGPLRQIDITASGILRYDAIALHDASTDKFYPEIVLQELDGYRNVKRITKADFEKIWRTRPEGDAK